jgi:hypothetical protein
MNVQELADQVGRALSASPAVRASSESGDVYRWVCGKHELQIHEAAGGDGIIILVSRDGDTEIAWSVRAQSVTSALQFMNERPAPT